MKLYHYISKGNNAQTEGILSFAKNPNADLSYYYKRSGSTTHSGIVRWMEDCFVGRSRGIRGFSEPIQWTEHSLKLKEFIDNADVFSIDVSALEQNGLLEAIYVSPSVLDIPNHKDFSGVDEVLYKLNSTKDIDKSPINWTICNDELGRRFAYIRYYLIVIKNGIIPPQYITKEN